jgi:hypothetical protein
MKFLDEAKIYVKSGEGGAGCLSFRREKFIEFGATGSTSRPAAVTTARAATRPARPGEPR